jgi:hypothetical protein
LRERPGFLPAQQIPWATSPAASDQHAGAASLKIVLAARASEVKLEEMALATSVRRLGLYRGGTSGGGVTCSPVSRAGPRRQADSDSDSLSPSRAALNMHQQVAQHALLSFIHAAPDGARVPIALATTRARCASSNGLTIQSTISLLSFLHCRMFGGKPVSTLDQAGGMLFLKML